MSRLILLYGRQVLRKVSDLDEEEQICSLTVVYVNAAEGIEVGKRLEMVKVPERLSPMQQFSLHAPYHLCTYFR